MRGHKMPAAHATHPNVTPLIDIVMCLIIFYMLVAKIGVNMGHAAHIAAGNHAQGPGQHGDAQRRPPPHR